MRRKFFIIAGEVSGDIHGSLLMNSMCKLNDSCEFAGIGGVQMESKGLSSMFPLEKMSIMGFVEVIKHLSFFKEVEKKVIEEISKFSPERIIMIDYPGFNLRVARKIKKQFNIPITYYISPQIWAWKEGRIKNIKKYIDQMLVIFPFEKEWYSQYDYNVEWVGHPFLENWEHTSKSNIKAKLGVDSQKFLLTLFPGSRKQEFDKHLKICLDAAQRVINEIKDVQVTIGLSPNLTINKKEIPSNIIIESENPRMALEAADAAIVASGTSTLEASIYATPMVIIYKMNIISWWLSKLLVKTKFSGMPNIISNKMIVPELLQSEATPEAISNNIIKIIKPGFERENMLKHLNDVRDSLGDGNSSIKAAKLILGI